MQDQDGSCSTPWNMYLLSDIAVMFWDLLLLYPVHNILYTSFALEFIRQSAVGLGTFWKVSVLRYYCNSSIEIWIIGLVWCNWINNSWVTCLVSWIHMNSLTILSVWVGFLDKFETDVLNVLSILMGHLDDFRNSWILLYEFHIFIIYNSSCP